MTFIILSLISLLSATCYGAVDLEDLKLKAAAYAQNAMPAIAKIIEIIEINQEAGTYKATILDQLLNHVNSLDIETDYQYDQNRIEKYREKHKLSEKVQPMNVYIDDEKKESFRNALLTNNSDTVAQAIRELCAGHTVDTEGNPLYPDGGYWGGLSPLQVALVTGQYDIALELIINHKADINFIAKNGATPLMCVIDKPHHRFLPDFLRFMIEQGANPEVVFVCKEETHSALGEAAYIKNFKAMQILEEEYSIHDPLMSPAHKAEWDKQLIDVGIMLIKKNDSIITPFKTIEEACAVFERVLAFKVNLEEGETLCVLPTKKIALHQDLPLLQAVNDKDKKLVAYMLNRWGEHIDSIDTCFAAIRALQTSQSDIVTLFKGHGVVLNDTLSGTTIRCDLDENNHGPHFLKLGTPSQEEKQELHS